MTSIAWDKYENNLVPTVIQNPLTGEILMVGFMNREALTRTEENKKVTFFSRSKGRLWTKGETSGHFLEWIRTFVDCDQDTILIHALPIGPTCHQGTSSCFGEESLPTLAALEKTIDSRISQASQLSDNSYVAKLFSRGLDRVIQKVGEEAVETVIAAKNPETAPVKSEAADLLFHLMVLLRAKDIAFQSILEELRQRSQLKSPK